MDLRSSQCFIVDGGGNRIPVAFKSATIVRELSNGSTQVYQPPQPKSGMKLVAKSGTFEYQIIEPGDEIGSQYRWINMVILESTGMFMFLDDDFFNSNIVQMVALQQYDRDLWELIYKSGYARVFRLKDGDSISWMPTPGESSEPLEVPAD